jgi:hypothetical protein
MIEWIALILAIIALVVAGAVWWKIDRLVDDAPWRTRLY